MWFVKIPSCIQFRGNYTFIIEGMKDKLHFAPSTIADFISIVQSLGYDLEVRILYEEDQSDVEENAMVRKLIQ